MDSTYENYRIYRRARIKFALKTYLLLFIWLIVAIVEWAVICLFNDVRKIFQEHYYICFATFAAAILLFLFFVLFEKLRFIIIVNFLISIIIVKLQIISTFAFCSYAYIVDILVFYIICVLLLAIFLFIGSMCPRTIDLTLDVAILFILGFMFVIVSVFFLTFNNVLTEYVMYTYLIVEIAISLAILMFVMYHAQTVMGSRFAEMRLNDSLLGSLILFHEFLIIYWLTFYWQVNYHPFTPAMWIQLSTLEDAAAAATAAEKNANLENRAALPDESTEYDDF